MSFVEKTFKTVLTGGQQVAIEGVFVAKGPGCFEVRGGTMFRDVQSRHVYFVDSNTCKLELEKPPWACPEDDVCWLRRSAGKVIGMCMPRGARAPLADMATLVCEAAQGDTVTLVLGEEEAKIVMPEIEATPGVDLEAISMPSTPPTPPMR